MRDTSSIEYWKKLFEYNIPLVVDNKNNNIPTIMRKVFKICKEKGKIKQFEPGSRYFTMPIITIITIHNQQIKTTNQNHIIITNRLKYRNKILQSTRYMQNKQIQTPDTIG
jgi:hypothetical protein